MHTRRIFIKNSLGSLAALTIGSEAFSMACTGSQKEKLGVALVGLGYYSTDLLAPALQQTENCYLAGNKEFGEKRIAELPAIMVLKTSLRL